MLHHRAYTPNFCFIFTGKELDPETGYSYFGARYLDHELMTMWLSVDPMADKYPSISPYAYCAWNPVKLVDPQGMDIWELDKKGIVVTHTENENADVFYIVDDNGCRINDIELSLEYGSVVFFESKYDDSFKEQIDVYELLGDENGTRLFEFLADNTDVEWSHYQLGESGEDGFNVLSTTHLEGCDKTPFRKIKEFKENGCTFRVYNHSHPNGDPRPSGTGGNQGDLPLIRWIYNNYTTEFESNIYTPRALTDKYHPYDINYERILDTHTVSATKPR